MAKTLTQIQTGVRYNARDDSIDLTDTTLLAIVNRIYRRMSAALPFPELTRRENLNTTTADQNSYSIDGLTNKYTDFKVVEILNNALDVDTFGTIVFGINKFTSSASTTYKSIHPPATEQDWDIAGRTTSQQIPDYYRRLHDGTNNIIEFRPAPSTASQQIRVTGIIEPSELTAASSTTIFLLKEADEVFEHLIAAEIIDREGTDPNYANTNRQQASGLLTRLFGVENVPEELRFRAA